MTFGDILLNILLIPVLAIAGILVLALMVIIAEWLSSKWDFNSAMILYKWGVSWSRRYMRSIPANTLV